MKGPKTMNDAMSPKHDPNLVEIVEQALAPYKKRFPPEVVEHFRKEALALAATHPYPAALLDALRQRKPVVASTTADKGDPASDIPAKPSAKEGDRR
jgi:hypothetical protein